MIESLQKVETSANTVEEDEFNTRKCTIELDLSRYRKLYTHVQTFFFQNIFRPDVNNDELPAFQPLMSESSLNDRQSSVKSFEFFRLALRFFNNVSSMCEQKTRHRHFHAESFEFTLADNLCAPLKFDFPSIKWM